MKVRVTELSDWQDCRLKWQYSWRDGLRPKPGGAQFTLSGKAIHFGIESALLRKDEDPTLVAEEAARLYLDTHGGDGSKRFYAGVQLAIWGVPSWVWEVAAPQAELGLEVVRGANTIAFRPDLWYATENKLVVIDFKSTSKDEWDRLGWFQVWDFQVKHYAVLVAEWLRSQGKEVPPLYTQYIVLSTRGKHAVGQEMLISHEMEKIIVARRSRQIAEIAAAKQQSLVTSAVGSAHCKWCDFAPLCEGLLTGAHIESIIEESYTRRNSA